MPSARIPMLLELIAADPADLLAHLMLGNEYLADERFAEAARHLGVYCRTFDGDKGAACLSLARALEASGDLAGAREALHLGHASASAFRHRALLENLDAESARLREVAGA